jgi:hypothetical protein
MKDKGTDEEVTDEEITDVVTDEESQIKIGR